MIRRELFKTTLRGILVTLASATLIGGCAPSTPIGEVRRSTPVSAIERVIDYKETPVEEEAEREESQEAVIDVDVAEENEIYEEADEDDDETDEIETDEDDDETDEIETDEDDDETDEIETDTIDIDEAEQTPAGAPEVQKEIQKDVQMPEVQIPEVNADIDEAEQDIELSLLSVAEMKLNKSKNTLKVGGKFTLKVANIPSGATVKYATSNKAVAKVTKKGKVTAVSKGTATIKATVTLKNGIKKIYKCKVTVEAKATKAETVKADLAGNKLLDVMKDSTKLKFDGDIKKGTPFHYGTFLYKCEMHMSSTDDYDRDTTPSFTVSNIPDGYKVIVLKEEYYQNPTYGRSQRVKIVGQDEVSCKELGNGKAQLELQLISDKQEYYKSHENNDEEDGSQQDYIVKYAIGLIAEKNYNKAIAGSIVFDKAVDQDAFINYRSKLKATILALDYNVSGLPALSGTKVDKATARYTFCNGETKRVDDDTAARLNKDYSQTTAKRIINYYTSADDNGHGGTTDTEEELRKVIDHVDYLIDMIWETQGQYLKEMSREDSAYALALCCMQVYGAGSIGLWHEYYSIFYGWEKPWYSELGALSYSIWFTNASWYYTNGKGKVTRYFSNWLETGGCDCWGGVLVADLIINRASERSGFTRDEIGSYYLSNGTDHAYSLLKCGEIIYKFGGSTIGEMKETNIPGGMTYLADKPLPKLYLTKEENNFIMLKYGEIQKDGTVKEVSYKYAYDLETKKDKYNTTTLVRMSFDNKYLVTSIDRVQNATSLVVPDSVVYLDIMGSTLTKYPNLSKLTLGKNLRTIDELYRLHSLESIDASKCGFAQVSIDKIDYNTQYVQSQLKNNTFTIPLWARQDVDMLLFSRDEEKNKFYDDNENYIGPTMRVREDQQGWITSLTHELALGIIKFEIYNK